MQIRSLVIILGVVFAALTSATHAATYYVDPATGNMTNPGTSSQPWSTLAAVFAANKTFVAGDVIRCRTGYHGIPTIKNANTGNVTIQPDTGATPTLGRIIFNTNAQRWVLTGFDVCPENAGAGTYLPGTNLVDFQGNATDNTITNCAIRAVKSIAGFTVTDWYNKVGGGNAFWIRAKRNTITNNLVENVGFGIVVYKGGEFAYVGNNTVRNYYQDGTRSIADDCTWEYNVVENSFVADANHDDCFQSWSIGADNVAGHGTIYRNTLRGNLFIAQSDPSQPLASTPQGIGCFDGMYEGWVIENNIIISDTYHGIALYGAVNCRIVNNTVTQCAAGGNVAIKPWVKIFAHKANSDGTPWPVPPSGNTIRNNIAANTVGYDGSASGGGVADHNLVNINTTALYGQYFVDWTNFDLRLKTGSPAIDAGIATNAPLIDALQRPRVAPFDVGAYEYALIIFEPFDYALTTNVSTAPDSASDFGLTGTTWGSTNDIIAGLSYPGVDALGNALQFNSNVGAPRGIDMTQWPSTYKRVDTDGVTRLGNPGSTLWVSFLIRCDDADTAGTGTAQLGLLGAASGGGYKVTFGDTGNRPNWGIAQYTNVVSSAKPIVTGQTTLIVARIRFITGTGNDIVDMWVNPPIGPTAPTTPDVTMTGLDIGTFDRIELKGSRKSTGDEVVISTDWGFLF
jgi:parallel beta-helix repeat protein